MTFSLPCPTPGRVSFAAAGQPCTSAPELAHRRAQSLQCHGDVGGGDHRGVALAHAGNRFVRARDVDCGLPPFLAGMVLEYFGSVRDGQ
jgi:hypothetical protein